MGVAPWQFPSWRLVSPSLGVFSWWSPASSSWAIRRTKHFDYWGRFSWLIFGLIIHVCRHLTLQIVSRLIWRELGSFCGHLDCGIISVSFRPWLETSYLRFYWLAFIAEDSGLKQIVEFNDLWFAVHALVIWTLLALENVKLAEHLNAIFDQSLFHKIGRLIFPTVLCYKLSLKH